MLEQKVAALQQKECSFQKNSYPFARNAAHALRVWKLKQYAKQYSLLNLHNLLCRNQFLFLLSQSKLWMKNIKSKMKRMIINRTSIKITGSRNRIVIPLLVMRSSHLLPQHPVFCKSDYSNSTWMSTKLTLTARFSKYETGQAQLLSDQGPLPLLINCNQRIKM